MNKKDKRGVMGIETGKAFLVGLLALVVIGVVFMVVLNAIGDTALASEDVNGTMMVIGNATEAADDFFSNTGTWLALLAIVILILIIAVVVVVVNKFGGRSSGL